MENSTNNSNNCISSINNGEEYEIYLKSDNTEIIMNDEADEVTK